MAGHQILKVDITDPDQLSVWAYLEMAKTFLIEARLQAYRNGEPPEHTARISLAYDKVQDCLDYRDMSV